MDVYTLDFETYYDQDYSLSKLTTEDYVRDSRFEVIGLAIKKNDKVTKYLNDPDMIERLLSHIDFSDAAILAQNTMFDGAILSWRYGVKPKVWFDTMNMGRALHGVETGASLRALSERYGIGQKGFEVLAAKGKRRADFTAEEAEKYGEYCIQDVELTYKLFKIMGANFPRKELKLIDVTLRMFIDPVLDLDIGLLEQHLEDTRDRKDKLLVDAGVEDKKDLMSNPKFADMLRGLGVEPPMKISLTTGKETYAFAKSDEDFKALQEHEDDRVQSLVAARLGNKSTLEETRTERFIGIAKRGLLPVPVRYYAAHTGRWGGADKINLQNLPSRGPNGKKLKKAIIAPEGYTVVEADSSQIEARVLAWFAGQDDLVDQFARGEDVYKYMASSIYNVAVADVTKDQRFVGKTTILGAGYGMGAEKFGVQLKTFGFEVSEAEAQRIISIYREANFKISQVWRDANNMVKNLANNRAMAFGKKGVITVDAADQALIVPSGLKIFYPELYGEKSDMGFEYSYKVRRGRSRLYGGKVIENVCQAIARCIIGEQMLRINKKYKVVLTVHDSIVCCVPDEEVAEAQQFVETCMRWTPDWAAGLPVDCESGTGKSYGDCE
jgi:DNA polymerase I-like protein with 3'-5' exonuclease and polymerase domains